MSTNRENLSYPELFPTIERFLDSDKLRLRFFVPPGFGKTTTTGKLIVTRREYKYLVVEPTHDNTAGKGNLEEYLEQHDINWIHYYGKGRKVSEKYPLLFFDSDEEFCQRPQGEKYIPGCETDRRKCRHYKNCEWRDQKIAIELRDVVICVYQNLNQMVSLYKPDIIIFDESMENQILREPTKKFYTEKQLTALGIKLGDDITPKRPYHRHYLTIHEASIPTKSIPELNEEDYLFNYFLQGLSKLFATKSTNKKGVVGFKLFGLPEQLIPECEGPEWNEFSEEEEYEGKWINFKIIFNCATTSEEIMNYMFKTTSDDWEIFRYDVEIKNPMVRITGNWGVNQVDFYKANIANFINELLQRRQDMEGFIICKQGFEKELFDKPNPLLDEPERVDHAHYFNCRGTNKYNREYLFAIGIGRFALTPVVYDEYIVAGLTDSMVQSLETSEILQGIHRTRLYQHPDTPVLLFTMSKVFNTLAKTRSDFKVSSLVFVDIFTYHLWSTKELIAEGISLKRAKKIVQFSRWLSKSILHDGIENQVMELTANGLTKKLIAEELGISKSTVNRIRRKDS